MAVAGADKFAFLLSDIRSRDDATHTPLFLHRDLPGDLTAAVQLVKSECLLISADLKDGIGRCVHDHVTGSDLFLSQFVQDRGSAGALISYYFVTGAFFQLVDQLLRETVIREGLKRFRCVDSHHLPVSGHGVLAVAGLG